MASKVNIISDIDVSESALKRYLEEGLQDLQSVRLFLNHCLLKSFCILIIKIN